MPYSRSTKAGIRTKRVLVYLLIANCCNPFWAMANPADPKVIHGQATFTTNGNQLNITNTSGTVIDWGSFSIDSNEVTRFSQQNASSVVLNRITGQDPSQILGSLQSNGKVVIINPNGILFGQNARVDVNGLTASSLNITNQDALAKKWNFEGSKNAGKVQNDGTITTPSGGQVYLIAPNVENNGLITTPEGEVILAAGHKVQLIDSNDPDVQVVVSASENQAVNLGRILAQSGSVGIYGGLINQRGTINANSAVVGANGKIVLKASDTTLLENGSLTSATSAGTGGEIQVLGDKVGLVGTASIDASGTQGGGSVLVGGDYHGDNAAIQNASRTFFGSDASIKANALEGGDGGKVVVWADESTKAYGTISALGGMQSGNGGFVETSGKQTLDFHAHINVGARNGKAGTLLLDPATITLIGGSGDGDSDGTATFQGNSTPGEVLFADSSLGASNIYQSELEGISSGTNIVLEATDYISASGAFGSQLTLPINSNLTLRTRNAATDGSGSLGIDLSSVNLVASGTGSISVQTGVGASPQVANIVLSGIQTAGGSVTINGTGSVKVGAISTPDSSSGGNVTINAGGYIYASGDIDTRPGSSGTSGNVTLNAGTYLSGGTLSTVYADSLVLFAGTGIYGSNNSAGATVDSSFHSATQALSARNTTSGNILISNAGSNLTIQDLTTLGFGIQQSGSGDIALTNMGNKITVADSVTTAGGMIDFTAAKFALQSSVAAGSGIVSIGGDAGIAFSVGSSGTDLTANTIELSNTELDFVTADQLNLYGGTTLNISSSVAPANINKLGLFSQGAMTHTGSAVVTASSLILGGHTGINLNTATATLFATNSGGSSAIAISNTGPLTVDVLSQSDGSTGSTSLQGSDSITVTGNMYTTTGSINISAHNALTIDGSVTSNTGGNLTLSAGTTGSVNDKLTLNSGAVVTSTGVITLNAGDAITVAGGATLTAGATQNAFQNGPPLPSLSSCIADPSLSGCSSVLPSLSSCIANPSLGGCSVVLPSLAACVSNPTAAGCSVVLPSLASCITTPSLAGCSVVLPTIASCTATPTLAGCSAVLPSLSACTANPGLAGCSVVLPSLSACTASPTLPGCSAVLPSLASCTINPTLAGCSAILPSLADCTLTPTLAGCSAVLPSIASCTATPTLAGCSAVLPTIAACTAAPTLSGCSVVLPSLASCTVTPSLAGCSAVLPSLASCTASPTLPGCAVVLPSIAVCTATPTLPGCSAVLPGIASCVSNPSLPGCAVVLPTLASCVTTPSLSGCSVVLPSLTSCIATPSLSGCSVVLPSLASCVTAPTASGCSVVLPSLASCVATPTLAGCTAVLPSLAACVTTPTLAGCAQVLPPVDQCTINPSAAGCSTVFTQIQTQVNQPVVQAINATVNIVNTVTTTVSAPANFAPVNVSTPVADTKSSGDSAAGGVATTTAPSSEKPDATKSDDTKKDEKKDDKKDTVLAKDTGAKKDEPVKKLYCN